MSTNDCLLRSALLQLPHGPEFRFVDRVVHLEPGKNGSGEYRVRGDEPFLRGHFPGNPVMPGVLLLEAAAQLAGIVAQSDPDIPPLAGLKLTAMRSVKIVDTAHPGEVICMKAQLMGRLGGLIQCTVVVSSGERTLLMADITLAGGSGSSTTEKR